MSAVDLNGVMNGLKPFQSDAVMHVADLFYGEAAVEHTGRYLIADETGLGKSVVARGLVAQAIRALEQDDSVDRIDVVYICSNADLAQQNLQRLNVTGRREITMATRLSLLATQSARLQSTEGVSRGKLVNLVSFTPGTSFSMVSRRDGNADERALITLLLDDLLQHSVQQRLATRLMFQRSVTSIENFVRHVENFKSGMTEGIDPAIRQAFWNAIARDSVLEEFIQVRDQVEERGLQPEDNEPILRVLGHMRKTLSRVSVETLEPDLVILDEFQRFKDLLDTEKTTDASDLANEIFSYRGVKVLLLSATPYKPFTKAGEDEENHYEDFLATIKFLTNNDGERVAQIREALSGYRAALQLGEGMQQAADHVRDLLIPIMSRSERPSVLDENDLVTVRTLPVEVPTSADLSEWMSLAHLGEAMGTPISLEYWKSIPYFANFMDGYSAGKRLKELSLTPAASTVSQALTQTRSLSREDLSNRVHIDPGNGPLRALQAETVDRGWWRMLWMPPSMPYLEPGPIYRDLHESNLSKLVIFSAWSATPTAISTLMTYEAERRMYGADSSGISRDAVEHQSRRLTYRQTEDGGASLSTLALFWPHPGLLTATDQLEEARHIGRRITREELLERLSGSFHSHQVASQAWEAFFSQPGAFDDTLTDTKFAMHEGREEDSHIGLSANIHRARVFGQSMEHDALWHPDLAEIAAFSPGSIAYRSVSTLAGAQCTTQGIWRAAYRIAEAFRGLFNKPETQALLDTIEREQDVRMHYWKRILAYCADGNLRAVLDEYLFQLWCEQGQPDVDDTRLLEYADAVTEAVGLRAANYAAHEATLERGHILMPARFAIRYGGGETSTADTRANMLRQRGVRNAFNSPFAPFILASTSVGQEGIDFHWWSHSVVHWNLPNNPVDFEQREGRVNRYGGLAVRKNVASAHWEDVLRSTDRSPWRTAFDAASAEVSEAGEFSPWWVYPGGAQIERVLLQYPLSRDIEKYEQLKSALTLYRLTLGQPRQEDMVEMLAKRNIDVSDLPTIDLSPPRCLVAGEV